MNMGPEKDLHRAMSKHLRAGVTPGLFDMDALRFDQVVFENQKAACGDGTKRNNPAARAIYWMSSILSHAARFVSAASNVGRNRIRHPY